MIARIVLLVLVLSPIIVFAFIGALYMWRKSDATEREVDELRTIVQKSEDDRPWNTMLNNLERDQSPYGTSPKEKN